MTEPFDQDKYDRACLYGDEYALHTMRLIVLMAFIVAGACLGCAVYGLIAWIAVCP